MVMPRMNRRAKIAARRPRSRAYARGVHHRADTVSLKLRARANAGTHQDCWRSDRPSRDRESFSVNHLDRTVRLVLDSNGAAVVNYDLLGEATTANSQVQAVAR